MKRRSFLAGSTALATVTYASKGIANLSIGGGTLTTVSDGTLQLPMSPPVGVPEDELLQLMDQFGLVVQEPIARPLNVSLWRSGDRTVLFDAGSGPSFVDSAGALLENLDAAGVAVEEITDVVFTHAHPDHIWGILDDFDEVPFPEARLWIGQQEFEFWTDPATINSLGETAQFFAVGAKRRLDAIAEKLEFIRDGAEIMPGLTALETFGHTPGHLSFVIRDGGDAAIVLGDAVTNAHLQFARPGWVSGNDQDPEMAARTRMRLLSDLATSGMRVVGYHLPNGGIGRVETADEGYLFVPEDQ